MSTIKVDILDISRLSTFKTCLSVEVIKPGNKTILSVNCQDDCYRLSIKAHLGVAGFTLFLEFLYFSGKMHSRYKICTYFLLSKILQNYNFYLTILYIPTTRI